MYFGEAGRKSNLSTRLRFALKPLLISEFLGAGAIGLLLWEESSLFPHVLDFARYHLGDGMTAPFASLIARATFGNVNSKRDALAGIALGSLPEFASIAITPLGTFDPLDLASIGFFGGLFYAADSSIGILQKGSRR